MNTEKDIAIKIEGLKKKYRLGVIGGGTLQADIQSWVARIRGKEDPNTKIGSKQYNGNETFMALNGVDLTVYKGERLGIIGHNGAGKSTLLKLLSRVTAPTEGRICIDGRISSMLEVGTGFNPELTGRENIYLNGAILGMSRDEVTSKIEEIIEFSECRKFIDTPVKRYSSGMYVKLAFAVSAHLDSEILVMDEVLAVGDMKFQQKCLGKMSDVAQNEGRTVLYVSHNMNTIRQLCDRCVVLSKGEIIFDGDVESAIQIYMDNAMKNKKPIVDLNEYPREGKLDLPYVMKTIKLLNSDNCVCNDVLDFEIQYNAEKEISDVYLRVVIRYADKTPICMSMTDTPTILSKGYNSLNVKMDCTCLATGKYMATFSLFKINEFGEQTYLDVVQDAVKFEIEKMMDQQKINSWKYNVYGAVMLPSIRWIEK